MCLAYFIALFLVFSLQISIHEKQHLESKFNEPVINMFVCSKCSHETRLFSKLISHYRFVHGHEHGFYLTCSVDGCEKQYTNVDSYLKHVKRKHKSFHMIHFSKLRDQNRNADIFESLVDEDNEQDNMSGSSSDRNIQNGHSDDLDVDFQRKFGIFFLSLREKYKLPAVVLPQVIQEVLTMLSHHQAHTSLLLNQFLSSSQLGESECTQLREIMEEKSEVENALSNLDSEYKINKFARFWLRYVKPVEYKPSTNKSDTYQYVPILETLRNLLTHDDIFSYVLNNHKSTDTILRDFCDGEMYGQNSLFSSDARALQIMLFYDDFTAVNPLGHQVKNYKIGAFYMLLGNLPPKFRSQLQTIQLVALCLSSTIKKNGFGRILDPFINDMATLETTGITISKDDQDYQLYGTVSVVIADNLGAHSLGGFMESFNTLRNCRFCFISRQDMQAKFDCQGFNLRTIQMYNQHVGLVQGNPELSTVYGVKINSPLNNLGNYHVINGMPSDLAHDLFEGVVCDVMKLVIEHCVTSQFFSLEDLNEKLSTFKFSAVDKSNKPCKVSVNLRNFKVNQSAAQMWCFVRHFPLLVGNKVPVGDQKWECLLLLRDLLFYVCAPNLDRGHVLAMSDIIEEFHESFRGCFPNETVKPKFHYTLHYPRLTLLFGPLIHLQTLRFEGKHNYFKELVYRSKNRKNLCKSLAERHQYYQCTFNTGGKYLSDGGIESSGGSLFPLCLLSNELQQLLTGIVNGNELFLCKSLLHYGIHYFVKTCVVTGIQGSLYQFSKIINCAIIQGVPYLLCEKLRTVGFDRHFHCFTVCGTNSHEILRVSNLTDPYPHGLYDHPGRPSYQVVVMKSKVLF